MIALLACVRSYSIECSRLYSVVFGLMYLIVCTWSAFLVWPYSVEFTRSVRLIAEQSNNQAARKAFSQRNRPERSWPVTGLKGPSGATLLQPNCSYPHCHSSPKLILYTLQAEFLAEPPAAAEPDSIQLQFNKIE